MSAKTSMRNKIIYAVLAIAVAGGAFGYYLWNKPHQDIAAATADVTMNAADLVKECAADENAANTKYTAKVLAVKGKVINSGQVDGVAFVELDGGDPDAMVKCNMDPLNDTAKSATFTNGEEVTLKGTYSGFEGMLGSQVTLDRCVKN